MQKKIFSMILAALIAASSMTTAAVLTVSAAETPTNAAEASVSDFEYKLVDNTAAITGYKGTATVVSIPSEIDGVAVTCISDRAFQSNKTITSVTIPSGVTTIQEHAFSSCSALTTVSLPDTLESLGNYAFYYCTALTSAKLPPSLKTIGNHSFYYCEKLADVTLPQGIQTIGTNAFRYCKSFSSLTLPKNLQSVGNYAFGDLYKTTSVKVLCDVSVLGTGIFFNCNKLTSVSIPSTSTSIPAGLFQNCNALESFTIPSGVTSIGANAFDGCVNLNGMTLPSGLKEIGSHAFDSCQKLVLTSLPDGVTKIPDYAFQKCYALTKLPLNDNITSIGSGAFHTCSGLTEITIPQSVTTIGSNAFSNCGALTEVTIPKTVKTLGSYAFSSCSILKKFVLESSSTMISPYTFMYCTALEDVSLPAGLTSIPTHFFYECKALKSISIPDSVTKIEDYAFRNNALQSVILPAGLTSLGTGAFSYCKSLTNINIPDKITTLSNSLFNSCTAMTEIPMGKNVTTIGSSTFESCTGLTSVTIPEKVTSIGSSAFSGCTALTSVKLPSAMTVLPNSILRNTALTSIDLPSGLKSIQSSALESCKNLKEIEIPAGVTEIGSSAFSNCTSLEKINIPSGVTVLNSSLFSNCKALKSFTIPSTITTIKTSCFSSSGLVDAVIPDSVTTVENSAFYNCQSLKNIKFSANMTKIPVYMLGYCQSLRSVTIPSNITNIENSAFYSSGLRELYIPKETTTIYDNISSLTVNLDLIIYSTPDSAAKAYADKYNVLFCDTTNGIKTLTDKKTGISVKGAIESGTTLKVTPLETNVYLSAEKTNVVPDAYYEISLIKDNKPVESTNAYEVVLPVDIDSDSIVKAVVVDGDTATDAVFAFRSEENNLRFAAAKLGKFAYEDCSKVNISDTTDAEIVVIGSTVKIDLKSAGGKSSYYRYTVDVAPSGTEEWKNLGKNTTVSSYTYTPETTGLYDFRISVSDSFSITGNKTITVKVNDPLKNTSTVSKKSTMLGNTITINGKAEGGTEGYTYQFYYKQSSAASWKAITATGTSAQFTALSAGSYDLKSVVTTSDGKSEEKTFTVTIKKPLENTSAVSAEKCIVGEKVTMNGSAANGMGGYLYAFYYKKAADTKWTVIGSAFSKAVSADFTPAEAGTYQLKVIVKDSEGNKAEKEYTLTAYKKLSNSSTISADSVIAGTKVTLNAKADGGFGDYTYALMYKKSGADKWTKIGTKYGTADTGSFTPKTVAVYDIMINVKDSGGHVKSKTFKLNVLPTLKNKSTISAETVKVGERVTLNAVATGGTGGYTYALMYKKHTSDSWVKIGQKYGTAVSGSFAPGKAVLYDVRIIVKDSSGKTVKKDFTVNVTK